MATMLLVPRNKRLPWECKISIFRHGEILVIFRFSAIQSARKSLEKSSILCCKGAPKHYNQESLSVFQSLFFICAH